MRRYYDSLLERFTRKKFLFLSGPRQVGKTTSARVWLRESDGLYLNWDIDEDRAAILKNVFTANVARMKHARVVLDEIHKYARWKAALKGLYDRNLGNLSLVVTGSARLDVYAKGGDSLLGRYEYLRVHPFSVGEVTDPTMKAPPADWLKLGSPSKQAAAALRRLESRSGFPEPYLSEDAQLYKRWSIRRKNLLLREDVRDLANLKLISLLEHLVLLLPDRIGSPLSINSLREEVGVNHETASSWLNLLDRLYFTFRIKPFSARVSRSLKKEQKLYLWDWASIPDEARRFENLVASHLLKSAHLWTDVGYGEFELHYLRNKEKAEIDFVLACERKPVVAVECKLSDSMPSTSWRAFESILKGVPRIQLVRPEGVDFIAPSGVRVVSASTFLSALN
ncbi:MAG: ATP-binding protein [Deltaproteobacteria bacterium]|nr:ATP-binding protein [Deltaproteobacteria bacterium]